MMKNKLMNFISSFILFLLIFDKIWAQTNTILDLDFKSAFPHTQAFWWPWGENPKEDKPVLPNMLELEEKLSQKIVGQPHAVKITSDALICYQAGIHDPKKPIATFLYVGPTGVGKTELAKELARQLFNDENRLLRFDMSEYKDREGLTRLIGVPNGYKESEKGGLLSNAILKQPFSIVLLDEIEKCDPIVYSLFLHIFDEGYFTSAIGEHVDCRLCLFIATTNLGAHQILNQIPFSPEEALLTIEPLLIKALSPELYNRVEPVVFQGLTREMLESIAYKKLQALAETVYKQKQVTLIFDDSVVEYLKIKGYHEKLGARPLQRLIKQELSSSIAKALLKEQYRPGDKMFVSCQEGHFVLTKI
jgi:ATP-dependent Clp protease ATP-binding subunit ClpB